MRSFHVSIATIESVVQLELFPYLIARKAKIITLEGPLGAGKTTLIKILLRTLGVTEATNSPTFSYVNHYNLASGITVNHFDLYRLSSLQEFYHEALDEFLNKEKSFNFIEWPGVIGSILQQKSFQESFLKINIEYIPNKKDERLIVCL